MADTMTETIEAVEGSERGDSGKWPGGYWRREADGRPSYVIRKMIAGKRYVIATRCHTERAALAVLERFEKDPAGFSIAGTTTRAPLHLTAVLILSYVEHARDVAQVSKGHLQQVKRYLTTFWLPRLKGVDLRRMSLGDHIVPALAAEPSARRAKIKALRCLTGWLRKVEHTLTSGEDATRDLPLGAIQPAQWKRERAITREVYQAALGKLEGRYRDALVILGGVGWHTRELVRFSETGKIEALPPRERTDGAAGILVSPLHKNGAPIRSAVDEETLAAGKRLLAAGPIGYQGFLGAIEKACVAAGVPTFRPGAMRHSWATWAIESGADPAAIAAFMGHKSSQTLRRFYATLGVVPRPQAIGAKVVALHAVA